MAVKKKDSARLASDVGATYRSGAKQLGWTQEMVVDRVGVDAETIFSRIERGAHLPSLPTLDGLAVPLRCFAGDLLSKEGPDEASEAVPFGAWISELGTDDRAFVMTVVRNLGGNLDDGVPEWDRYRCHLQSLADPASLGSCVPDRLASAHGPQYRTDRFHARLT